MPSKRWDIVAIRHNSERESIVSLAVLISRIRISFLPFPSRTLFIPLFWNHCIFGMRNILTKANKLSGKMGKELLAILRDSRFSEFSLCISTENLKNWYLSPHATERSTWFGSVLIPCESPTFSLLLNFPVASFSGRRRRQGRWNWERMKPLFCCMAQTHFVFIRDIQHPAGRKQKLPKYLATDINFFWGVMLSRIPLLVVQEF